MKPAIYSTVQLTASGSWLILTANWRLLNQAQIGPKSESIWDSLPVPSLRTPLRTWKQSTTETLTKPLKYPRSSFKFPTRTRPPYGLEHGLHGPDPPASLGPLGLGALVPRREVSDQGESRRSSESGVGAPGPVFRFGSDPNRPQPEARGEPCGLRFVLRSNRRRFQWHQRQTDRPRIVHSLS